MSSSGRMQTPPNAVRAMPVAGDVTRTPCCLRGHLPRVLGTLLLIACPIGSPLACGQASVNNEPVYKAVTIAKLPGFLNWPPSAFTSKTAPFRIGVLGKSPIESTLARLQKVDRKVGGRRLQVEHYDKLEQVHNCQIVLLPSSAGPDVERQAARRFAGKPVLLLGETESFAELDAGIVLDVVDNRLKIIVYGKALQRSGITGLSRLSRVAEIR